MWLARRFSVFLLLGSMASLVLVEGCGLLFLGIPFLFQCGNGVVNGNEECDDPADPFCTPCCTIATQICSTDNECAAEEYCDYDSGMGVCNSCDSGCASNADCPPGQVCTIGGVCGSVQCNGANDCAPIGSGLICSNGRCLPSLACDFSDAGACGIGICPTGQSCGTNISTGLCSCDPPVACDLATPGVCGAGACESGMSCAEVQPGQCGCVAQTMAASMYGVNPNPSFSIATAQIGVSSSHQLTFDVWQGELETFRAVLTYPADFGFNGFLAQGPVNTDVGHFSLDLDFDGTPEHLVAARSLSDSVAYADLNADGAYSPLFEPTMEHSGGHVLTVLLPFGGDGEPATTTAPTDVRMGLVLLAGVMTNPTDPGTYSVAGSFTSVDPDTDGFDDSMNESPLIFATNLDVEIVAAQGIPATSQWGITILALLIIGAGTLALSRRAMASRRV